MLKFTRSERSAIIIGDSIRVTVLKFSGNQVRLVILSVLITTLVMSSVSSSVFALEQRCDNSEYLRTVPREIRWANDNPPGSECYRAVKAVRKLENDPRFDCDVSVVVATRSDS